MVEILPSMTTFRHLVPGDIPNLLTLFHDGLVVSIHQRKDIIYYLTSPSFLSYSPTWFFAF